MKPKGFDGLATLVASCATAGVARQALLLRVDRLPVSFTRPHYIRLAEAALAPMLRLPRAELFHLPGPSLAVVWRGGAESELLDVIDALEHLLVDQTAKSPVLSELVALYDLPNTGDLLLETFAGGVRPAVGTMAGDNTPLALNPSILALLEGCLAQADVARFARRKSVWQVDGPHASLAWEDRALSIAEITDELAPGYDLAAEPWLFRRLTRTLDRRMLALLASPGELAAAGPFCVDLKVASLLCPDFFRFDAALPAPLRGRVVIAMSPADIVSDSRSFQFAAGFARARGYRLLLRADTAALLRVFAPALAQFDHVTVPWTSSLPADGEDLLPEQLNKRFVLTGCDTQEAIAWGLCCGIRLFTGIAASQAALV